MGNTTEELVHKHEKSIDDLWDATSDMANKLLNGTIDFEISSAQYVLRYLDFMINCNYRHHRDALSLYEKVNERLLKFNPEESYFG